MLEATTSQQAVIKAHHQRIDVRKRNEERDQSRLTLVAAMHGYLIRLNTHKTLQAQKHEAQAQLHGAIVGTAVRQLVARQRLQRVAAVARLCAAVRGRAVRVQVVREQQSTHLKAVKSLQAAFRGMAARCTTRRQFSMLRDEPKCTALPSKPPVPPLNLEAMATPRRHNTG